MARVKNDLVGVLFVRHEGEILRLSAGDEVPDGVQVSPELLEAGKEVENGKPRSRRGRPAAAKDSGD